MSEAPTTIEFGEPDGDTCLVTVGRTVGDAAPAFYGSVAEAQGNQLATKLLEIGTLEAVLLQDRNITLLKPVDGDPWEGVLATVEKVLSGFFAEMDAAAKEADREMTPEEKEIFAKVQNVLNEEVNPLVASHGGFIEVLAVKGDTTYIHMGGGCQGCGMASVTLKQGVERAVMERVPEVVKILDTTDHASGTNPYYAPTTK